MIGPIPPAIHFAGRLLSKPLDGGKLFRCLSCHLVYRYPSLNKDEVDALYRQGNAANWQTSSAKRPDWKIANDWISRKLTTDSAVLDVGCFDGQFLNSLESVERRVGIEIHEGAREKAKESGVNIIGSDFAALADGSSAFDAVTAFDVIEHTHNPINFLTILGRATRKSGIVIVSSGNSNAPTWKLLGGSYWYCVIGEHLSFINPDWCAWAAPRSGLKLDQIITFSHVNGTLRHRIVDLAKNLLYAWAPRGFAGLRSVGMGGAEYRVHKDLLSNPPSWMTAKDHIICLFVKQ